MIKVIKPAQMDYRCTCSRCKAILEFRKEDTQFDYHNGWDYSYVLEYIDCPKCGNSIYKNEYEDKWEEI